MKYIIYQIDSDPPRKVPIIFPSHLVHLDVARTLSKIVGSGNVYSAGELVCRVKNCNGKSTTIGISNKEGDEEIINNYDYFFGMNVESSPEVEKILKELTEKILEDK